MGNHIYIYTYINGGFVITMYDYQRVIYTQSGSEDLESWII